MPRPPSYYVDRAEEIREYHKGEKMEISPLTESIIDAVDCIKTLNEAADFAGGAGFEINELKDISALELISRIAPNNIRFFYRKPELKLRRKKS